MDPARQASKRRQHSGGGEYQPSSFSGPGRLPLKARAVSCPPPPWPPRLPRRLKARQGGKSGRVAAGDQRQHITTPKIPPFCRHCWGSDYIFSSNQIWGQNILFGGEMQLHRSTALILINGPIYNSKHLYRVTCQIFLDSPLSTNRWDQIRSDLILAPRRNCFRGDAKSHTSSQATHWEG